MGQKNKNAYFYVPFCKKRAGPLATTKNTVKIHGKTPSRDEHHQRPTENKTHCKKTSCTRQVTDRQRLLQTNSTSDQRKTKRIRVLTTVQPSNKKKRSGLTHCPLGPHRSRMTLHIGTPRRHPIAPMSSTASSPIDSCPQDDNNRSRKRTP